MYTYTFKLTETVKIDAPNYSEAFLLLPEYHYRPFVKVFIVDKTIKETANA